MKKKILQRIFAVSLTAAMVVGSAGCGKQTTPPAGGGSSTDPTTTVGAEAQRQTVTFMTLDFNAGASNTGEYAEEIKSKLEDFLETPDADHVMEEATAMPAKAEETPAANACGSPSKRKASTPSLMRLVTGWRRPGNAESIRRLSAVDSHTHRFIWR
ncbi:MAG: hypothetical protein IKQ27_03255 [Lachnospiraceae bacterium]|nr:hypothetical protein [Lachnospiraceae bacterium]